jgi:hypothetical protein
LVQILLDGQIQDITQPPAGTLAEVLEQIRDRLRNTGRMIVTVQCDGQELNPDLLESRLNEPVDNFQQIDFQTETPRTLANDALQYARELTGQIETLTSETVDTINQGRVGESMDAMGQLFRKWNDVYQAVYNVCSLMQIDPSEIHLDQETGGEMLTDLVRQLQEVKTALENKDFVLLADVLGYELGPAAEKMGKMMDILQQNLSDQE